MNNLKTLTSIAANKEAFQSLLDYVDFSLKFFEYVESSKQAEIIAQNDHDYRFYQFNADAGFKVTRPFNSKLLYDLNSAESAYRQFIAILAHLKECQGDALVENKAIINNSVYTLQQSIGFALDAGTANGVEPNVARKINGDLFECLVRLIIRDIGLNCTSGSVSVPVKVENHTAFNMTYQHDLIIKGNDEEIKMIGSVKTTSKDRVDKIFVDKFLYCKLTDTCIPHIAVFLHDVQRKKTKKVNEFGINSTFLAGHFKGYTVKLNPLDGVYYIDLRPNMLDDSILKEHITNFDVLLREDIWKHI
ncbi:MAG: hypothetical protein ABFD49_10390 [Armatimonadota bacterium]|nr:hypothetical protein [bacterium]